MNMFNKPKFRIKKVEYNGHVQYAIQKLKLGLFYKDIDFDKGQYNYHSSVFVPNTFNYICSFESIDDVKKIIKWLEMSDKHEVFINNDGVIYFCYFDFNRLEYVGDKYIGYVDDMEQKYIINNRDGFAGCKKNISYIPYEEEIQSEDSDV